jgi:hypothetical protein
MYYFVFETTNKDKMEIRNPKSKIRNQKSSNRTLRQAQGEPQKFKYKIVKV